MYISVTSTLPFTSKCNNRPDSLPCSYSLIKFSFSHPFNVYLSLHLSALNPDNDHTPIMYISLIIWLPVSLLFPFIAITWSFNSIQKKKKSSHASTWNKQLCIWGSEKEFELFYFIDKYEEYFYINFPTFLLSVYMKSLSTPTTEGQCWRK